MHARGFVYQDISLTNILFDPVTGDICLADIDNVDIAGMPTAISGTLKFMAPELVRRETFPSVATDQFSMAVLFFWLLHSWHPLEGKRAVESFVGREERDFALYGTAPLFIFDSNDDSNGPVPGMHDLVLRRWKALSHPIRSLFTTSFTVGLNRPEQRIADTQWRTAFKHILSLTTACKKCGYEQVMEGGSAEQSAVSLSCKMPFYEQIG